MSSPPVYTALNVPTVTSYPSVKCLQWSPDGQACFSTKTAAYIMTPDHGVHFETSTVIKSVSEKDTRDAIPPIGWFRTIIPFDKTDVHRWPEYSQAWGAASLGSIDVALWDATFSPSGLSTDSGCILAALTSNMDLTLWAAAKNYLKGEWIRVFEVTPFLLEAFSGDSSPAGRTAQALKAQITSVVWSQQADFGVIPTPVVDGSVLLAGNRAGSLIFLRYRADKTIQLVHSCPVADTWITNVTISSWTLTMQGTCEAYVAYGTADGAIGLAKVTQSLEVSESQEPGLLLTVESDARLYEPDKAGITALSWIEVPHEGRILVHCKPGLLHVWAPPSPNVSWSGYRTFRLQRQRISTDSSSLHPASGIQYIRRLDALVLTLYDGSFHVFHNLSTEPSIISATGDGAVTSESLSKAVRSVFIQSELNVDFSTMNRITGLASYDGSATFIWIQEAARPSDFSYKHEAKHQSTLVVSRLWDDDDDDAFIHDLDEVLNGAKTAAGLAPLYLLRPFFFRLRDRTKLSALHLRILEVLKLGPDDHSVHVTVPSWPKMTPEFRSTFRRSLTQHLFGRDILLSLRMRLSLADFAWKHSEDEEKQNECGQVAQNLLNTISHRNLRTIIRHLAAAVNLLTPNDIPFVLRMVVQSMLPGSPPDLSAEGENLQAVSQAAVFPDPSLAPVTNIFNELCPACRVEVPLQDITTATCSNGHTWARCSITTFILSTPFVRTCVGCSRKAFLPLSASALPAQNWLPDTARGWVVEELLEAVHRSICHTLMERDEPCSFR
ncbi:putative transcription factor IIIC subunit delta N-term [Lyophyllum shimeji]|uniref:Transcription factor IIIC subunit delta N-term n=1 Tax=Lyophyllum shimeji TaxID=47721 RepID=A0A9P3UR43_LYOSH|nr:putative transcription factor IIIC subunit delta N-term [Lyophyllum shimeji]